MSDPVAQAAAQIAADAAPSSTEPSIIDEIKQGIHTLEEKVEHFIHPESAEVAQAGELSQTSALLSPADGQQSASASSASATSSPPSAGSSVTGTAGGEAGEPSLSPSSGGSGTGEGLVIETKQYADGSSATGVAPLPDLSPAEQDAADLPNAAASPAASQDAGNTASSAASALPSVATTAVSTSTGSAIRERLQAIKGHLAGFEESSVQKIVGELEAIERML